MNKEVSVKFTGDASKLVNATKQGTSGLKELAAAANKAGLGGMGAGAFTEKGLSNQPDLVNALKANAKVSKVLAEMFPKPGNNPFLKDMLNQQMGIGAGQNRPAKQPYEEFWKKSVPPFVEAAKKSGFFERMAGGYGGSSKMGSMFSTVLGGDPTTISGIFGTLGALRIAFWELEPIIRLVKMAFAHVAEAFKAGEKLFINASQQGKTTGALFSSQFAGNAIGLSDEQQRQYALQTAGGSGGKGSLNRFDVITKSLAPSLVKPYKEAYEWSIKLGDEWKKIAGELFTTKKMSDRVSEQMNLFWAEIAAKVGPSVRNLFKVFGDLPWATWGKMIGDLMLPLRLFFDQLATLALVANKLNLLKPTPGGTMSILGGLSNLYNAVHEKPYEQTDLTPPGGVALPNMGAWEKLGLTFGAGGASDYAKTTADSTKKSASMLEKLVSMFEGGDTLANANAP